MRFKFYNILKQIAPNILKDKTKDIVKWGSNNDFPQRLIETIYESHTMRAMLDTYIDFLEGSGFSDEVLNSFKVNKEDTLLKLHEKICPDATYLGVIAIHVVYNASGQITSLRHIPAESTRLGIPDDMGWISKINYNPFYGINSEYKDTQTISYDVFDPNPEIVKKQMLRDGFNKYKGQILWIGDESPMRRFYPEPFFSGGIKWAKVDNNIGTFHERNIDNNFLLSCMINMIGDPDQVADPDNDPDKKVGELFDEVMSEAFSGASNGGKAFVAWSKNKEESLDIKPFPTNTNHDLFLALQNLTTENLSIATKVIPVLAGIGQSGKLGSSQEILNAIKMMQHRVSSKQKQLEGIYEMLLSKMQKPYTAKISIRNLSPINIIPSEYLQYLTTVEARKYMEENFSIELEETPEEVGAADDVKMQSQANLRGSVGGVQAILAVQQSVTGGITEYDSAIEILKEIFGFEEEMARRVLGTKKELTDTKQQADTNAIVNKVHAFHALLIDLPVNYNVSEKDISDRYNEYYSTVNMTYSQLERWSNTECSSALGLTKIPIARNLELLNINKSDWTAKHYRWAGQTITAINRMKDIMEGEPINIEGKICGTRKNIILKNWAYNLDKDGL